MDLRHVAVERPEGASVILGQAHEALASAYPVLLNALKALPTVCRINCATSNPLEVVLVQTRQGGGIVGVVDGQEPLGIEREPDVAERKALLRTVGYKL